MKMRWRRVGLGLAGMGIVSGLIGRVLTGAGVPVAITMLVPFFLGACFVGPLVYYWAISEEKEGRDEQD